MAFAPFHCYTGIPSCLLNAGGKVPRRPRTHDMNSLLESYLNLEGLIFVSTFPLFLFSSEVAAGEVEIQGGIYDLETGHVEFLGQSPAQDMLTKSGARLPLYQRLFRCLCPKQFSSKQRTSPFPQQK